jgi:hypothetical protein
MLKYYYLLLSILVFGGCSLTDNDQPIPSYLIINDVSVFTTQNQGAPTHKISDVWVYADNQLVGVFEVPTRIPLLVNGDTTLFKIFPGIRNNGEKSRSFIYHLLDAHDFELALAPGEEVEKSFVFTYSEDVIFDFIEGFESDDHLFTLNLDNNDETNIVSTDESSASGLRSGKISLDDTNNEIAVASIFKYQRAQNAGIDSYLEMDYKCDMPFFVGVIYVQEGQEVTQPLLVVNPKEDWNKIYIDFTQVLTSPVLETYRIYFTTDVEPLSQTNGEVFLDNLKFVHF